VECGSVNQEASNPRKLSEIPSLFATSTKEPEQAGEVFCEKPSVLFCGLTQPWTFVLPISSEGGTGWTWRDPLPFSSWILLCRRRGAALSPRQTEHLAASDTEQIHMTAM
jgi:hypothetical protein